MIFISPNENICKLTPKSKPNKWPMGSPMITYLNVPYAQKDDAKALGAQWSPTKRKWFITDIDDIEPFLKWMPEHLKQPCRPATK